MNSTYFIECVLGLLTEACYPAGEKYHERRVMVHFSNMPIQNTQEVQKHLSNFRFKGLYHPPDGFNVVPCDFFLFSAMKENFSGQRFESAGEHFLAVAVFLRRLSADFLQTVFWNGNDDCRYALKVAEIMFGIQDKTAWLLFR
jgi:hypothetical protein